MTTQQQEAKLDKRIAFFENTLNLQMLTLTSHVFDCQLKPNTLSNNMLFAMDMVWKLKQLVMERKVINSKVIPFKSGSFPNNDMDIISECGKEIVIFNNNPKPFPSFEEFKANYNILDRCPWMAKYQ